MLISARFVRGWYNLPLAFFYALKTKEPRFSTQRLLLRYGVNRKENAAKVQQIFETAKFLRTKFCVFVFLLYLCTRNKKKTKQ